MKMIEEGLAKLRQESIAGIEEWSGDGGIVGIVDWNNRMA